MIERHAFTCFSHRFVRNMLIFPMCCVSYSVSFDSNIIFYSWVPRLRKYFFLNWFCRIKMRTHLNWICAIDWKDLSLYNVQPTLWNPTGNNQIITTSMQSNVRIDCKHLQMFLPATYMDQIMHQPTNRMSRAKQMAENTMLTHKRTRCHFHMRLTRTNKKRWFSLFYVKICFILFAWLLCIFVRNLFIDCEFTSNIVYCVCVSYMRVCVILFQSVVC